MRKLFLGFSLLLISQFGFGQMVSDQAVVPVSVTLNSILRLNVTSGGNIVFVFNTIDQYEDGIAATTRTTTTFMVSSSRLYDVSLIPENVGGFLGLETGTLMPLNNVGFTVTASNGGTAVDAALHAVTALSQPLTLAAGATAGGGHTYEVAWECGTQTAPMNLTALSAQVLPTDIYVNNMFLTLAPH